MVPGRGVWREVCLTLKLNIFRMRRGCLWARVHCVGTGGCGAAGRFLACSGCGFRFGRLYIGLLCILSKPF